MPITLAAKLQIKIERTKKKEEKLVVSSIYYITRTGMLNPVLPQEYYHMNGQANAGWTGVNRIIH